MLSFYPEFEACEVDDVNVVLLLDMSNSMKGDNLNNTKKIALLTLQYLPSTWNFNIVVFGTGKLTIYLLPQFFMSQKNLELISVERFCR